MNITKRSFGAYTELTLTADTKEEVIEWRNYFFQWGAINLCARGSSQIERELSLSNALDNQEKQIEDLNGNYQLSFQARKDRIIAAFKHSAEVNLPGGKRVRAAAHKMLEAKALERFEQIPCQY